MKRYGNLYSKLVDIDNIRLAYHNARKGKAWQAQVKRNDYPKFLIKKSL